MAKKLDIPNLQPQEFDDFLFDDWKPTVQNLIPSNFASKNYS